MYWSTRRNKKDTDIWIDDLTDDAGPRLAVQLEGGGWAAVDFSHDAKKFVLLNGISANETQLYVVDTATGDRRLVTPQGSKVAYSPAYFSVDDGDLYFTSDEGSEFQHLVKLHLADGRQSAMNAEWWDVDAIAVSQNGRIAYLTNENGVGVLHLLDSAGRAVAVPKIPQGVMGDLH